MRLILYLLIILSVILILTINSEGNSVHSLVETIYLITISLLLVINLILDFKKKHGRNNKSRL